jgi:hypothetical protein
MEYKIAHELQVEINGVQVSNNNTTRQIILGPEFEEFNVVLEERLRQRTPNKYSDHQLESATKEYLCNWVTDNQSNKNLKKVPVSQYYALNETEDYKALRHRIRNSMKTKGGLDKMVLLIRAHLQIGTRGEGTESGNQDTEVTFALSPLYIYDVHNFLAYLSTISPNVGSLK